MTRSTAAFGACCLLSASLVAASAYWQGMPDPDHYRVYAEKYAAAFFDGGAPPDRYRPPIYPILLAPIVRFTAAPEASTTLVHILWTLAIVAAVWRLARRVSTTDAVPIIACSLVAVDPILVRQSGQYMTETLFTALMLWALAPWIDDERKSQGAAAVSGLAAGLAFLTRPTMAPIFAAVGAALLLRRRWSDLRRYFLAVLVMAAVVLPWALRNKALTDHIVVATTHGGYTLWLGNNPSFFEVEVLGRRNWAESNEFNEWQGNNARLEGEAEAARQWNFTPWEIERDSMYRKMAIDWIQKNPAQTRRAALYRLSMFWGLQPRTGPEPLRPAIGGYFAIFLWLAALGWLMTRSYRGPWLTATLVVVALSLVHAVYWSNMRFRAPIEPLLAVWAATAIAALWRRKRPAT